MTCSTTWIFKHSFHKVLCCVTSRKEQVAVADAWRKLNLNRQKKHKKNNYLIFLLHTCLSLVCEVKDGEAEFLVAMEALQHTDSGLLRVWVFQALWMDNTLNLCHTIGAHHSVGLGHFRSWHGKRYKWLLVVAMKKQIHVRSHITITIKAKTVYISESSSNGLQSR